MLILIGTAAAVSRSGRRIPAPLFAMAVGALAALAVLSVAIDLIPDELEITWASSLLVVVIVLSGLMWLASGQSEDER
jgi:peptidoglycan/LPS O-acetylase OafA/YrhL